MAGIRVKHVVRQHGIEQATANFHIIPFQYHNVELHILPAFTDGSCTVSVNLDGPFHVIISRGRHGMYYNTLNVRVDLSGGTVQLVELSE